jgi:thiamine-phosphate pyrophosphorylase
LKPDLDELRAALAAARLMLLFTPGACAGRDPRAALEAALEAVDVVQVRPKRAGAAGPCAAREVYDWTRAALEIVRGCAREVPVIADDRVDVALALAAEGCAGVHLGRTDCPTSLARELLGPDALIGLSTHTMAEVALAADEPVDYLGFGPAYATRTKGYEQGLGPEACWIAAQGTALPVFAIGGIDSANAGDLAEVGRAAVCAAILGAPDPARAARELRALLESAPPTTRARDRSTH